MEHDVLCDKTLAIITTRRNMFPVVPGVERDKLEITDVGLYSISHKHAAWTIAQKAIEIMDYKTNLKITDATAGNGGNTINFALHIGSQNVNAIEIDKQEYDALCNNLKVYHLDTVLSIHGDCLDILDKLTQDVIFFDPPWGGRQYKAEQKVNLFLSQVPINQVINKFKKNAQFIILKVPQNFDYESFVLDDDVNIIETMHLKKFDILVIKTQSVVQKTTVSSVTE